MGRTDIVFLYNGGEEGLACADTVFKEGLAEGIDQTEEVYKREILQLRIENERLKKLCSSDERNWRTEACSFKGEEFEMISHLSRDDAVKDICSMMGLSRASYYK